MARNTDYDQEVHDNWAMSLAFEGLTDMEIAQRMGIARSTLKKWEKEHASFSDSLKQGKEPADAKVQKSLYQRAIGYTFKEKKVIVEMDSSGNQKPARIETTERVIPPDTTAQIFWLKNRRPDQWRDKRDIDATVNPFMELMKKASADDE